MSYYLIKELLEEASVEECARHEHPYVALVTAAEFDADNPFFDMGIDMDVEYEHPGLTKAVVNFDSLTGCFQYPTEPIFSESLISFLLPLTKRV